MLKEYQSRKRYPSDLTDEQWTLVEPLLPPAKPRQRGGRPRQVDMREVLNTIRYLHRSGCQWDMLPHDLLPKSTAYDYFAQWRDDGTWSKVVTMLREQTRVAAGREPTPSAVCIDSKSVKTTEIDRIAVYFRIWLRDIEDRRWEYLTNIWEGWKT